MHWQLCISVSEQVGVVTPVTDKITLATLGFSISKCLESSYKDHLGVVADADHSWWYVCIPKSTVSLWSLLRRLRRGSHCYWRRIIRNISRHQQFLWKSIWLCNDDACKCNHRAWIMVLSDLRMYQHVLYSYCAVYYLKLVVKGVLQGK